METLLQKIGNTEGEDFREQVVNILKVFSCYLLIIVPIQLLECVCEHIVDVLDWYAFVYYHDSMFLMMSICILLFCGSSNQYSFSIGAMS